MTQTNDNELMEQIKKIVQNNVEKKKRAVVEPTEIVGETITIIVHKKEHKIPKSSFEKIAKGIKEYQKFLDMSAVIKSETNDFIAKLALECKIKIPPTRYLLAKGRDERDKNSEEAMKYLWSLVENK